MLQKKAKELFIAVPYGKDHVPGQRELICVVVMHCDIFEQILKGQIITKRVRYCRLQNFLEGLLKK